MSEIAPACRNPDCEVATTGKCALNHELLDSCEEYGAAEADLDYGDDDRATDVVEVVMRTRLRSSDLLKPEQLWPLQKQVPTRTVALVGDFRAGKTTLISALYASLCKGPLAGYSFRSSRTLTAFARRHHDALLQSKRNSPVTLRTSRQDRLGFFHLCLRDKAEGDHNLLIADRSGEIYAEARSDTSLIGQLTELVCADRVCFLLDSARLADVEQRHTYKRAFKQQIHSLLDNGALSHSTSLEMVTTKLDKLKPQNDGQALIEVLDEFEAATLAEFSHVSLTARRVCALPRADYTVGVVGLDSMLQDWLAPRAREYPGLTAAREPVRQLDRIFEYWDEAN
jgi:Double-GTPase 2